MIETLQKILERGFSIELSEPKSANLKYRVVVFRDGERNAVLFSEGGMKDAVDSASRWVEARTISI